MLKQTHRIVIDNIFLILIFRSLLGLRLMKHICKSRINYTIVFPKLQNKNGRCCWLDALNFTRTVIQYTEAFIIFILCCLYGCNCHHYSGQAVITPQDKLSSPVAVPLSNGAKKTFWVWKLCWWYNNTTIINLGGGGGVQGFQNLRRKASFLLPQNKLSSLLGVQRLKVC